MSVNTRNTYYKTKEAFQLERVYVVREVKEDLQMFWGCGASSSWIKLRQKGRHVFSDVFRSHPLLLHWNEFKLGTNKYVALWYSKPVDHHGLSNTQNGMRPKI